MALPTGNSMSKQARSSPLAHAASGQPHLGPGGYQTNSDPFELLRRNSVDGTGPQTPTAPVPPTPASSSTSTGSGPPAGGSSDGGPLPQYDLSVDPVLQQVQAAATASNTQATGKSLKDREQLLLQYGDPALASAVLGADDPFAQAAQQNPESTLARLKRGYDEGLWNFDNTLDPSLAFSGARIKGEGQLGQGYQDDLASAAAGVQSQLGSIQDAFDSTEAGNADKVSGAWADAYNRAVAAAMANPPAAPTTPAAPAAPAATPTPTGTNPSLATAAAAGDLPWIYAALHGTI